MSHPKTLDTTKTALVVIDVQEAFRSAIPDFALIASRISMAVRGFQILKVPILITEQYPKGLGRTAEEIMLSLADETDIVEKTTFSSVGSSAFVEKLAATSAKQIMICGVETHVCVNQTAHDLVDKGYEVHLLTDCVASRFDHDKNAGLQKMLASGVIASSTELALFEMIHDSKHEKFKDIQSLIK
jgi:nicotinamidase-related amidase